MGISISDLTQDVIKKLDKLERAQCAIVKLLRDRLEREAQVDNIDDDTEEEDLD